MTFALGVIQFLVTILGVIAVLSGLAVAVYIIIVCIDKVFKILSARISELLEWILEMAKTLKKVESILPVFLTCIAELAVFTLGADFEPGDKGLLAVYILATISMIHLSFGESRKRLVGRVGVGLITALTAGYGIVFRKGIFEKYSKLFNKLEVREQLALLLVITMILLVLLVACLSWRERQHKSAAATRG